MFFFCILNQKKMFLRFLYEFEEIIWLHDLLLLCLYDLLMVTRIIWWHDLLQIERYFIFVLWENDVLRQHTDFEEIF